MSIGHVLGSETGLTLVATLFGAAWAAVRSSAWYQAWKGKRYAKALEALEAGVELTYRTYVRSIKDARSDGKLTDEEMSQARNQAREAAVAFGRAQGLDVISELGSEYIDLLIAKVVKKQKS
jgi:hypothetical protein